MNATLAQITSRAAAASAAHQLEHTTAAVHELARIYGFSASEALQKLDLGSATPAREDVLARLLADSDPVPAKQAPKRPTARSPEQKQKKAAEKEQKAAAKAAEKEQKAAEKAALRIEKQAQKALAKFVKLAEKAEKDAQKAAAKAQKEALKAQKEALKAEKAAKRQENQALKAKRLAEREARAAEKTTQKTSPGLEEEELDVEEFEFEGANYLRGPSGEMFDAESHDPVGWWNEAGKCISPEQPPAHSVL